MKSKHPYFEHSRVQTRNQSVSPVNCDGRSIIPLSADDTLRLREGFCPGCSYKSLFSGTDLFEGQHIHCPVCSREFLKTPAGLSFLIQMSGRGSNSEQSDKTECSGSEDSSHSNFDLNNCGGRASGREGSRVDSPAGVLRLHKLLSLFQSNLGVVSGQVLEENGFLINECEAQQLVYKSPNQLDDGIYLIGRGLEEAVKNHGRQIGGGDVPIRQRQDLTDRTVEVDSLGKLPDGKAVNPTSKIDTDDANTWARDAQVIVIKIREPAETAGKRPPSVPPASRPSPIGVHSLCTEAKKHHKCL